MFIINSAAYVHSEFQNELGLIPPCLLPIGNKKLIEFQVQAIKKVFEGSIYVSLPESYQLSINEELLLSELEVIVVFVPEKFSLGESLVYLLNSEYLTSVDFTSLRILHGDTLITELIDNLDTISVGETDSDYGWEKLECEEKTNRNLVWSGFFSFSDPLLLLKYLALYRSDFILAIRSYSADKNTAKIELSEWLDLGHINTYFKSRARITTERAFNSLKIKDNVIFKSSQWSRKIKAEAYWFNNVPLSIKKYTPNFLFEKEENNQFHYCLEYLPFLPLNEIFVHGRNQREFWGLISRLVRRYFQDAKASKEIVSRDIIDRVTRDSIDLYESKTLARVELFCEENNFDFNSECLTVENKSISYNDILSECISKVRNLPVIPAIMHGDLCFSNILYDSRFETIKVIDPRGMNFLDEFTIYGDQKYDLAKYTHSIIGLYDFIISGRYKIVKKEKYEEIVFDLDSRLIGIQEQYMSEEFIENVSIRDIIPVVILLFLSMLPLHSDDKSRQKAMLLNAVRLYKLYVC